MYKVLLGTTDTNYETDYNKMEHLGITNTNAAYWLASRLTDVSESDGAGYYTRCITEDGQLSEGGYFLRFTKLRIYLRI